MKRVIFLLIATSFSVLAEPENKSESPGPSPTLTEARRAIAKETLNGSKRGIEPMQR
jgi:hypothetical protein